ncbi:M56 family metallopeptidase [Nocardia uniformis]|uniref:M56 family metallopeptidase n=1 Tax=Nocardia uniformis TaxID=53432 RepID=A0A849CBP7_9NOCA|nr:M56 family metallopeptidase [Nocardia uniformis]NNH75138.1 M56 family metallopeptidase [Nocardia uniformis]
MSAAICLLAYGFAMAVLAPPLLRRLTESEAAPRFALAAWLSAIGSTALSWLAALVALIVDIAHHRLVSMQRPVMDTCMTELHDAAVGRYGGAEQAGLLILAGLSGVAGLFVIARLGRALWYARRTTFTHARMARIAGRHNGALDAVVLDVDEPAAYCVAGKQHTVVVTRGVLTALDDHHLDAVLAHERAHLSGRHHLLLALSRGLATVLPHVNLFTTGANEIARLLEMIADDAAARVHGRRTVLHALLTLSDISDGPTEALGATGIGLTSRVRRLADPTNTSTRRRSRLTLGAATVTAALTSVAALALAVVGLALCLPISG